MTQLSPAWQIFPLLINRFLKTEDWNVNAGSIILDQASLKCVEIQNVDPFTNTNARLQPQTSSLQVNREAQMHNESGHLHENAALCSSVLQEQGQGANESVSALYIGCFSWGLAWITWLHDRNKVAHSSEKKLGTFLYISRYPGNYHRTFNKKILFLLTWL